jgi:flavin reductase (DIM6/NTAB) family NADH-FMN oxidoreductase RutF
MLHLDLEKINALTNLEKRALINGIGGVKPLNLFGSISKEGHHNLALFNSVVHIGSSPPMLGFILRPTTVERHTYDNMLSMGFFTVNQVNTSIYKEAHQSSAKYDKSISEFEATGLTPEIIEPYSVPFVKESKLKLACKYKNEYFIEENGCRLVIAEILDIYADDGIINDDGFVNLDEAESAGAIGLDAYVGINLLDRLDYPRPKQPIKSLLKDGTP